MIAPPATIEKYLANLVDVVEGSEYTNDPVDAGGPTKYGVTQRALSAYRGRPCTAKDVQDLARDEALDIYRRDYVVTPGFDRLADVSVPVAMECIDTGVNMGPKTASTFLQKGLNALNNRGALWADMNVDGVCGPKTVAAVQSLLTQRGDKGHRALLLVLNCQQGARYLDIATADPSQKRFVFGWFMQRIQLIPDTGFYGST